MYAKGVSVSDCPFKALSYAKLSEHGSLDEMNKESRVVPLDCH
jgi:hypothetical protein